MYWLKLLLLDIIIIADFLGSTLITNIIVQSFPEGKFPAELHMPIWFTLFFVFLAVIIVTSIRLFRHKDSSQFSTT